MKQLYIILIAFLSINFTSCVDKDYFGEFTDAAVTKFEIENQISSKIRPLVDLKDVGLIDVVMPRGTDLKNLSVRAFQYSPLAKVSLGILEVKDFSSEVIFEITAEDALYKKQWKITVTTEPEPDPEVPGEGPQIDFANMTTWTKMLKQDGTDIFITKISQYGYTPGDGSRNVWSTTAEANSFSLSGINYFTTRPMPNPTSSEYARMETVESATAAIFAKSGVVAGALFTGHFYFDVKWGLPATSAPRKMLDFGVPFTGKPKQIKFKYRYTPGATMKDGLLQAITTENAAGRATKDSCEVYVILHNRSTGGDWVRVGAAWLRDAKVVGDYTDNNTFVETAIDFVYGKPSAQLLSEKPYYNIGGVRGELIFYTFSNVGGIMTPSTNPVQEVYADDPENTPVTHITVMFSSSAYGDKFWAASNGMVADETKLRGSTLDVKGFELVY